MEINEQMLSLTKQMVEIQSINGTHGEKEIAEFIENFIREIPYFKLHEDRLIIKELHNDSLHRRNVVAVVIGEKDDSKKTLLFHGHTDTVGLEGYGALEPYACKPDELIQYLKEMELEEDIKRDVLSGDYMFGRGSCDMKSGDAVFLQILKNVCESPEKLSGNLVFSFNPVEENLHTGMIESLDLLDEIRDQYGLEYIMAINNDFICPLGKGSVNKPIYTGMVGKILPCFYIQGKETHVGQCFEGVDAAMVAAHLVSKINLNREFSDCYENEYSYPPSVLKMKDLKPWYNVQTIGKSFVYFNYFVHDSSMEEITNKLLAAAREAMSATIDKVNEENKWFCEKSGEQYIPYTYDTKILTYRELYCLAKKSKDYSEQAMKKILEDELHKGTDQREVPIALVEYLLQKAEITCPAIVLYYAAPYCPHNTMQGENEKLIEDLKKITGKITEETGEQYDFYKFYPSLSDSSYLKIDDSEQSLQTLIDNFPAMETLYKVPIKKIRKVNIPTVNFGAYGKDAHKWTERVNIPYTFGVLPKLIEETISYYL